MVDFLLLMRLRVMLFLLVLASCSAEEDTFFGEYELGSIELELTESFHTDFDLNNPFQMVVFDSVIVIHDRISDGNETYFLRAIDVLTGASKQVFGREGRGPHEFLFPVELSRVPNDRNGLTINNRTMFEVKKIDLSALLNGDAEYVKAVYRNFNVGYSRIHALDTSRFIGTGFFGNHRYAVSDTAGSVSTYLGDYPFPPSPNSSPESLPMAYQSRFVVHPTENRVASATMSSPNFEVFSIEGDSLRYVNRINYKPVSIEDRSGSGSIAVIYLDENIHGYSSIDANEEFIYALFSGKPYSDENYMRSNTVIVFDWNGQPVAKITLPHEASQLSVHPDNDYLFTISHDETGAPIMSKFRIIR